MRTLIRLSSLFILSCIISPVLNAQENEREESDYVFVDPSGKKGFMFGLNIGGYLPNDESARFYDGTPKGEGFLNLEEYIGLPFISDQILQELGNSASSFRLAEYPTDMRYTNTVSFGGNLRYQFDWANAIVMDAFFIGLKTNDAFVLAYANDNGTVQDIFQNFDIRGREDRLQLSMGYQVSLSKPSQMAGHFEFGPLMTSVKIKENSFSVGSRTYNILRAQSVGSGNNQLINNNIPNITSFGAYTQLGINMEFDKFTVDLDWRTSMEKIALSPAIEAKYRLYHMPMLRLVYRVSVKGF